MNPPCQELVAKDLHGQEWKFRHIYRGIVISKHYMLIFYLMRINDMDSILV